MCNLLYAPATQYPSGLGATVTQFFELHSPTNRSPAAQPLDPPHAKAYTLDARISSKLSRELSRAMLVQGCLWQEELGHTTNTAATQTLLPKQKKVSMHTTGMIKRQAQIPTRGFAVNLGHVGRSAQLLNPWFSHIHGQHPRAAPKQTFLSVQSKKSSDCTWNILSHHIMCNASCSGAAPAECQPINSLV